MSELDSLQPIAPYLHPSYWEGHSLGIGSPTDKLYWQYNFRESRFANHILKTTIKHDSVVPIHTFYSGDKFDPAGYHPGTVVLYRKDKLTGPSIEDDYDLSAIQEQPVPVCSTGTFPNIGMDRVPAVAAIDDKRRFDSTIRWGVVPQSRSSSDHIGSVPANTVMELGQGIRAYSPFIFELAPIVIGAVRHLSATLSGSETLERINILHVIAYGTPEKAKRGVFSALARPALGFR